MTDIISQLEAAFIDIYKAQDGLDAIVTADEQWILADLPPELKHKIAVINYDYKSDLALEVGNLGRPNEIHVDPKAPGRRADTQADTLEDILASLMDGIDLGHGSPLWHSIRRGQCHNMYVPIWLEQDTYSPPKRNTGETSAAYTARFNQYVNNWSPWHLVIDPVKAVSFLDRQGVITLACRNLEIPIYQLATDYGDDEQALQLLNERFPGVRAGDSTTSSSSDQFRRKIKVKVIDDGVWITHHIERPDGGYDEIASYRNPFGCCSLIVLSGAFEMSAPMLERRRPLHDALLRKYQEIMKCDSLIASYNASAMVDRVLQLEGEAAAKWLGMEDTEREGFSIEKGPNSTPVVPGKMADGLGNAEAAVNEVERRKILTSELQPLKPTNIFNTSEAPAVVEYAKATSAILASEQLSMKLQYPIDDDARLSYLCCMMLIHAWLVTANPHYQLGSHDTSVADVPLSRTLTGSERVFGRITVKGQTRAMTPAALDFDFDLKIISRDDRLSTQAAIGADADSKWNTLDGVKAITYDDWLAAKSGQTNISAYKIAIMADKIYQLQMPAKMQQTSDLCTQYMAQWLGADPQVLSQQQDVQIDPNGQPPSQGGANPSNNQQSMGSPQMQLPSGTAS